MRRLVSRAGFGLISGLSMGSGLGVLELNFGTEDDPDLRAFERGITYHGFEMVDILLGTGNDIDSPGYIQSFDPETGEVQWRFYTVPMKAGDPGLDTWQSLQAARTTGRGGGGGLWLMP